MQDAAWAAAAAACLCTHTVHEWLPPCYPSSSPPVLTMLVLGIEGSANKVGVGLVNERGEFLANTRHTYITPPGSGFMPRQTSQHHQAWIIQLVHAALDEAGVKPKELDAIAYTKGPGAPQQKRRGQARHEARCDDSERQCKLIRVLTIAARLFLSLSQAWAVRFRRAPW